jgi:hypothetical protein
MGLASFRRLAAGSAKAKIRSLVSQHLQELAIQRRMGIRIFQNGTYDASGWNQYCQTFLDKIVLPRLSPHEAASVLRLGVSRVATQLLEGPVRRENRRQERTSRPTPARSNYLRTTRAADGEIASGLIIRPEPLESILSGQKDWEMRSKSTSKRGTLALIAKGAKAIYGVADIVDCKGPLSEAEMVQSERHHGIVPGRLKDPAVAKWNFAYVLSNVRRLERPIPCSIRPGAVTFVLLDDQARTTLQSVLKSRIERL